MNSIDSQSVKPFLRWAGGKSWLVKFIYDLTRNLEFKNYHEPFLGGGAIFFSTKISGKSFLQDSNRQLINTYQEIRDNPDLVLSHLRRHRNTKDYYYWVRDSFNPSSNHGKAAKFLYLNQTSFNGIYRVNLKGKYNVPFGFRTKNFYDPNTISKASEKLKRASISYGDFTTCLKNIRENDLVFIDPPYTISHNNNGFFKYNEKLFSRNDQIRLSEFIDKIKAIGAYYILTNAAHEEIRSIFDKGDRIEKLSRASLIGGKNASRGHYHELIFTNI